METKNAILELRKGLDLSQEEFAAKLSVTRQAVSRWENGETVPNTDMLKIISQTFGVSTDYLLGHPTMLCQSCGMALNQESDKGTERDGSRSEEYCTYCYQQGKFVRDLTMEEQIESNLCNLDDWNRENGLNFSKEEAREALSKFLPTLQRWKAEN